MSSRGSLRARDLIYMDRIYFVYILSNKNHTVFYTGVTNNLTRRVHEHKSKTIIGFTKRYNINKLLYFETHSDIKNALNREKQIKDYRREKKFQLINELNPEWRDLYLEISH